MYKKLFFITIIVILGFYFFDINKKEVVTSPSKMKIYIEADNGYQEYDGDSFPTVGYVLNSGKSTCENDSYISQSCPSLSINVQVEKSDKCTLYFDKITTPEEGSGAEYIVNLYNNGNTSLTNDCTDDKNIRYVGANPNNYVSFNNELWRIIGVFNQVLDKNDEEESLIKIVRLDPLGSYSWDTSASDINNGRGYGRWNEADLMEELNGDYLNTNLSANTTWYNGQNNKKTGEFDYTKVINTTYQNMIEEVKWYAGVISGEDYSKRMYGRPRILYRYEKQGVKNFRYSFKWTGKIALLNPSDYGLATNGDGRREECLNVAVHAWDILESSSGCYNDNYLHKSANYWTLSSTSTLDVGLASYYISRTGDLDNGYHNMARDVYPSLYLKSSVQITGGDGSISNPYILG